MRLLSAAALCLSATAALAEPSVRPASTADQLVTRAEDALAHGRLTEVAILLDNPAMRDGSSDTVLSLKARYALASGDLTAAGRIRRFAGGGGFDGLRSAVRSRSGS